MDNEKIEWNCSFLIPGPESAGPVSLRQFLAEGFSNNIALLEWIFVEPPSPWKVKLRGYESETQTRNQPTCRCSRINSPSSTLSCSPLTWLVDFLNIRLDFFNLSEVTDRNVWKTNSGGSHSDGVHHRNQIMHSVFKSTGLDRLMELQD